MTKCRRCARARYAKCVCRRRTSLKVRAHLFAIRMKGGRAAGAKRHREAVARWLQLAKGMTTLAFAQMVYRRGYHSGYVVGEQRGRDDGYERGFNEGRRQERFERAMRR